MFNIFKRLNGKEWLMIVARYYISVSSGLDGPKDSRIYV